MRLIVGSIVDVATGDSDGLVTGRIEEVVNEGTEVVRISVEGDPEPEKSRVHGKVMREHTKTAFETIRDLSAGLDTATQKALIEAVIAYSDIEVRNVVREAQWMAERGRTVEGL